MVRRHVHRTRAVLLGLAALVPAVAVSSIACQRDTTASAQTAQANGAAMRAVTVPVDGMICVVCAGRVKNTLKEVHGVQDAVVNLEKHTVTVHYENGKISVDELTRAINQLGYKAGVPTAAQLP